MSENDNGRPPVPGQGGDQPQPTQRQAPVQPGQENAGQSQPGAAGQADAEQPTNVMPQHVDGKGGKKGRHKGDRHALKTVLLGVCGGAVAALLVVFALDAAGVIGGSDSSSSTSDSSAGQTINITAEGEDTTVAKAAAAKALKSVVVVNVTTDEGSGLGSGVVYDSDGDIITNYHVIEGATSISVSYDDQTYEAEVVGSDPSSDIAVIKISDLGDTELTPIDVGDSDELVVGDWVMTVGSPFGLDQSVSAGIVSSLSRNQLMQSSSGETIYTNLIQTDAAINPGNSGGALVNSEGELVGICTLFSSDTESFAGIGFAIPSNYATEVADTIISGETVKHAYIGLTMQTVTSEIATANNLSVNQGAYVTEVTEGSPADDAGIEVGDIITEIDGDTITSADGVILAVRSHDIGDTVEVTFMRGDEEKTVEVTLGSDEALQEEQTDSTTTDTTTNNDTNGMTEEEYMQELYDYLYNNDRGGSYSSTDGSSEDAISA